MLADAGIGKSEINGYYTEEFTDLAVAAAVAGGVADVGLGIEAAARRLKIDFIPLFSEEYYLLAKAREDRARRRPEYYCRAENGRVPEHSCHLPRLWSICRA
jgi:molybdate-binding protein